MWKFIRNQLTWVNFVFRFIIIVSLVVPNGLHALTQNKAQSFQENATLVSKLPKEDQYHPPVFVRPNPRINHTSFLETTTRNFFQKFSANELLLEKYSKPLMAPLGRLLQCVFVGGKTNFCDFTPTTKLVYSFSVLDPGYVPNERVKIICNSWGCTQVLVYYSLTCSATWWKKFGGTISLIAKLKPGTAESLPPINATTVKLNWACIYFVYLYNTNIIE